MEVQLLRCLAKCKISKISLLVTTILVIQVEQSIVCMCLSVRTFVFKPRYLAGWLILTFDLSRLNLKVNVKVQKRAQQLLNF